MMKRDGKFTITQLLSVILAVAGVVLVVFLMVAVVAPLVNVGEETTKSYLKAFATAIEEADESGYSDFSMWQPQDIEGQNKKKEYWLIYFGDKPTSYVGHRWFHVSGVYENHVCVCFAEGTETRCGDCMDLKAPARYVSGLTIYDHWYARRGTDIEITKSDIGDYVIRGKKPYAGLQRTAKIWKDYAKFNAAGVIFEGKSQVIRVVERNLLRDYDNLVVPGDPTRMSYYDARLDDIQPVPGAETPGYVFPEEKVNELKERSLAFLEQLKPLLDKLCDEYYYKFSLGYITHEGVSVNAPLIPMSRDKNGDELEFVGKIEDRYYARPKNC